MSNQPKFFRNTPGQPATPQDHKERLRKLVESGTVAHPGMEVGSWKLEVGEEDRGLKIEGRGEGGEEKIGGLGDWRIGKNEDLKIRRLEEKIPTEPIGEKIEEEVEQPTTEEKEKTIPFLSSFPSILSFPFSPEELPQALKAPISSSLRWLATWVARALEKLTPQKFTGKRFASLTMTFFEVTILAQNEIEIAAAESFFAAIASLYKKGPIPFAPNLFNPSPIISLEIVADSKEIRFMIGCPKKLADFAEKQLHGAYPMAQIEEVEEYNVFEGGGWRVEGGKEVGESRVEGEGEGEAGKGKDYKVAFAELGTTGPAYFPTRTYTEMEKVDPLGSLLSPLSKLDAGEAAVIQFILQPAGDRWRKRGSQFVKSAQAPSKEKEGPKVNIDPEVIKAVSKKVSKVGLNFTLRVVAVGKDQASAEAYLQNILGSFEQFSLPQLASFKKKKTRFKGHFLVDFLYRYFAPIWRHNTVLNTEELATIWHLPNKNVPTPHIKWLSSKSVAAPTELPEQTPDHLYLGISKFRGVEKKVYLPRDDRRRHLYILGQTGTGKSEFLKHLAQQDIARGEGLAFIDPHGSAAEDLLKMIPKERIEEVIYFNPADTERPMGLNILEGKTEQQKHLAINAFIALLYKLYDPGHTGIMGPRLERAIRNVMLTAMSEEGNSLVEVLRMLIDPAFAKEKLSLVKDPLVRRYWTDELAQTSDFHKSEVLGYFVSKFDRFVTEILMRNIIGQGQSAFNFREIMDSKKILIVNLAKGLIGEENSNFLGLLLVPRILMAAMSRQDLMEKGMTDFPDFYLYVDEFQNFSTPDFVQILSEARKYRLNLTVANQFIGQLDEKIKDAVFGNVGSIVSFRVGPEDAAYMEKQFEPTFEQGDLQNLPIGSAYTRLLISGQPTAPFSLKSDWPAICALPRSDEVAQTVKELSRLKYGRDKEVVEAKIRTRAKLE